MISTRWQKQHSLIQHGCLVFILVGPIVVLRMDGPFWPKLLLSIILLVTGVKMFVALNNYLARTMVRVFELEHDVVVGIVQRALNSKWIHFNKQIRDEVVVFRLREHDMLLVIEPFPLNLPIDNHHIKEVVPATKIRLKGLNSRNNAFAETVSTLIDEVAEARMKRGTTLRSAPNYA